MDQSITYPYCWKETLNFQLKVQYNSNMVHKIGLTIIQSYIRYDEKYNCPNTYKCRTYEVTKSVQAKYAL